MDEGQKDSGEEQRDEDEGLGPRSNVSLLDQHQHLKEKAEGTTHSGLGLLPVEFFSNYYYNILLAYFPLNVTILVV